MAARLRTFTTLNRRTDQLGAAQWKLQQCNMWKHNH